MPTVGLSVGPDGSLFGTTAGGGTSGAGVLFKITRSGLFHSRIDFNGANGYGGNAPPTLLSDGSFFGGSAYGGAEGVGLLYRFTPKRRYQLKHHFPPATKADGNYANIGGAFPSGPCAQAADGTAYGTTSVGGTSSGGTVFKLRLP